MTFADALALLGLALAVLLYQAQRAVERRRDLEAARDLLVAVRDGIKPWGDLYFHHGYDVESAKDRALNDFKLVMEGSYGQVFHVPTEPLKALIAGPAAGGLLGGPLIEAANVALWQIGVFNQLARQQTDFNALHIAEFRDDDLPDSRRQVLAKAAFSISGMLHANGIRDAEWYANFERALEANINELHSVRSRRWWTRPSLALAVVFVIGAIVAATWTGIDRDHGSTPKPLNTPTTTTRAATTTP